MRVYRRYQTTMESGEFGATISYSNVRDLRLEFLSSLSSVVTADETLSAPAQIEELRKCIEFLSLVQKTLEEMLDTLRREELSNHDETI